MPIKELGYESKFELMARTGGPNGFFKNHTEFGIYPIS